MARFSQIGAANIQSLMRSMLLPLLPVWLVACTSVGVVTDHTQSLGPDAAIVLARINAPEGRILLSSGGMSDIYNALFQKRQGLSF